MKTLALISGLLLVSQIATANSGGSWQVRARAETAAAEKARAFAERESLFKVYEERYNEYSFLHKKIDSRGAQIPLVNFRRYNPGVNISIEQLRAEMYRMEEVVRQYKIEDDRQTRISMRPNSLWEKLDELDKNLAAKEKKALSKKVPKKASRAAKLGKVAGPLAGLAGLAIGKNAAAGTMADECDQCGILSNKGSFKNISPSKIERLGSTQLSADPN